MVISWKEVQVVSLGSLVLCRLNLGELSKALSGLPHWE
jgi:hypothetical protein